MTLRRTVGFGRRACVCGHSGVHQESRTHISHVLCSCTVRKYQCLRDIREHILKCNGTPCKISSVGAFHVLSLFSILAVRVPVRALSALCTVERCALCGCALIDVSKKHARGGCKSADVNNYTGTRQYTHRAQLQYLQEPTGVAGASSRLSSCGTRLSGPGMHMCRQSAPGLMCASTR